MKIRSRIIHRLQNPKGILPAYSEPAYAFILPQYRQETCPDSDSLSQWLKGYTNNQAMENRKKADRGPLHSVMIGRMI
jgi:hypothetical protein